MLTLASRAVIRNSAVSSLTVVAVLIVALVGAWVPASQHAAAQTTPTGADCGTSPLDGRTQVVVDAIMAHADITAVTAIDGCEDVTQAHLEAIDGTLDLDATDEDATDYPTLLASDFVHLSGVDILDLQGNGISSIPDDFFETHLVTLQQVKLGHNAFTTITDDSFEHWTGAGEMRLLLENNQISSFSQYAFRGLTNLDILDLKDNPITAIPGNTFSALTDLKHLWLDRTEISTLTGGAGGSFAGLVNVVDLWLREIDELTTIPADAFAGLDAVATLRLERSGITTIHADAFSGLTNLKHLTLQDNKLTEIPRNAFDDLILMTQLNLERNDIATIYGDEEEATNPQVPNGSFSGLAMIDHLTLQDNELTAIPAYAFKDMIIMTKLNLERNKIETLYDNSFAELVDLQRLLIRDNLLGVEDMKIDYWDDGPDASLTVLYLSRNKINAGVGTATADGSDTPVDFPVSFFAARSATPPGTGMTGITELGLDDLYEDGADRGLKSLNKAFLAPLTNLEILRVNDNPIQSFPTDLLDDVGDSLEKLYMHNMQLISLPDHAFRRATALKSLFLQNNDLEGVSALAFANSKYDATPGDALADLGGLDNLEQLDLSDNPGSPFVFYVDAHRKSDTQAWLQVRDSKAVPVAVSVSVALERSDGEDSDGELVVAAGAIASAAAFSTFSIGVGEDGHTDGVGGTTTTDFRSRVAADNTARNWDNSLTDGDAFDIIQLSVTAPAEALFTTPQAESETGICQDFDRICYKGFAIGSGPTVYPVARGAATDTTLPLGILATGYEARANRDSVVGPPAVAGGFNGWISPTNDGGDKVLSAYYEYRYRREQYSEEWANAQEPAWDDSMFWSDWTRVDATPAGKSFVLDRLTPGHQWEVETRTVTIMGTSYPAARLAFWTGLPKAPTSFTVEPNVRFAVLSWARVTGYDDDVFVGYRVRYRKVGTTGWSRWISVTAQTQDGSSTQTAIQTHTIRALDDETAYEFQVVTETINGVLSATVTVDQETTFVREPEISRIEPEVRSVDVVAGTGIRLAFDIFGLADIKDNTLQDVDGSKLLFTWSETSGSGGSFSTPASSRRVVYTAPNLPGTYVVQAEAIPPGVCYSDHAGFTGADPCKAVFTVRVSRAPGDAPVGGDPIDPDILIPTSLTDNAGVAYAVFTPVLGGTFTGSGITVSAAPSAVPDMQIIGVAASTGAAAPERMPGANLTLAGTFFHINGVQRAGQSPVTGFRFDDPLSACIPLPAQFRANVSNVVIVEQMPDGTLGVLSSKVQQSDGGLNVCGSISELPATVAVAKLGVVQAPPVEATPPPDIDIDVGATAPSNSMALWTLSIGMLILAVAAGIAFARRTIRGPSHRTV